MIFRKRYIVALLALALVQGACEKDFLNRAPGIELNDEKVFGDAVQAARYADEAYNYLINDYVRFNSYRGATSQASDEAVSGNSENTVVTLNKGRYHDHAVAASLNDIRDVWERSYQGIAITNKMLENIDKVPQQTPEQQRIFRPKRVRGEMHFIRALCYFELLKRFGGVPVIDKVYTVNDNVDLPRATVDETVNFILADLKIAENQLGVDTDPEYGSSNYGRATKGAASALVSRVLLYAASPVNNPTNDKAKWKLAADSAKSLMDKGWYSLQSSYSNILNVPESPEYIMIKVRGNRPIAGMFQDFSMSPASGGQQGQMNPTQNHVDMYEMVATAKLPGEAGSGYNPQSPYTGRDPRFYANVLYNSADWQGKKIETWRQTTIVNGKEQTTYGKDAGTDIKFTATSYYCKKYWPEVYSTNGGTQTLLNYIYFRYAEILLNYAEALNEAEGPASDVTKNSILGAINQIRARVNMPALQTDNPAVVGYVERTQEAFRARIRHERAIELAFEDHRWYDIMRWKIGVETINTPMYRMDVVKNANGSFTYTKVLLGDAFQKIFEDRQHRYPIPRTEIYKSKGILKQNPGWE
ncbi:RagB/SusD family nutrient uptake outer membrane protein [Desertivirga brevis]|uniref:RagB/SusD family nutrient uptake outer membrane protein n=1 Tax=Desertivirga brevis TaxID=2810310 RepID=UPI001A971F7C|nr:RagB/SusD family nutrient uptake outer membrane protein [Pedobacter sp. SYSU D00873]